MNKGQLVQHREWGMKSEEGGGGGLKFCVYVRGL